MSGGGVPVVLLRKDISFRMAFVDRFTPIYTLDSICDVNWNPLSVDYEKEKEYILLYTIEKIKEAYVNAHRYLNISYYYESRNKHHYTREMCEPFKLFIENKWKTCDHFCYSIWGLTQIAEWLVSYLSDNYPFSKLINVYDSCRSIKFSDKISISPYDSASLNDEFVFITAPSANQSAIKYFDSIGKKNFFYINLRC